MEVSNDSNRFMQFLRWSFSKREDQVSSSSTPFPSISISVFKPVAAIVLCFSVLFFFTSSFGSFFHAQPYGGRGSVRSWYKNRKRNCPSSSCCCSSSSSSITPKLVRGGVVFFIVVLVVNFFYSDWIHEIYTKSGYNIVTKATNQSEVSLSPENSTQSPLKPIPFTCPIQPINLTCPQPPPPLPTISDEPSPTCPEYFHWIHEDLKPWKESGITEELIGKNREIASFHLVIVNGRVYVEWFKKSYQTRDVFTMWSVTQLLRRYPGILPDVDIMFECNDFPVVKVVDHQPPAAVPPPMFGYCRDNNTFDIVFPDWSFWSWNEINIKPWDILVKQIKETNKETRWTDRDPHAHWRGNPTVADKRREFLNCNVSKEHDYNALVYINDWNDEHAGAYKNSNLDKQCTYRYKIYIEGATWSVSEKYILACDSPTLLITPGYFDFFTRGLMPLQHYWPIDSMDACNSIKFAVEWGNKHEREAEAIGKAGSEFMLEDVKMDYVYDYMFHLLNEYSKLQKFKPKVPPGSVEMCTESMACREQGGTLDAMMESMVKFSPSTNPCALPPPYSTEELAEVQGKKERAMELVKRWEKEDISSPSFKEDTITKSFKEYVVESITGEGISGVADSSSSDDVSRREEGLVPLPPFTCPPPSENLTCPTLPSVINNNTSNKSSAPTCPEYFRWIHEDLRPWKETGITREMIEKTEGKVHFRLVVVNGRAFIDKYDRAFQTRDVFTMWGLLQLLRRYSGRIPDLDMVFSCEDPPNVKVAKFTGTGEGNGSRSAVAGAPAQFGYCGNDESLDIIFPDWSFWGWPEINMKPWESWMKDMTKKNKNLKWEDRQPYAHWKGNPSVSGSRWELLKCNVTDKEDWNARLYAQDWDHEVRNGFKESSLVEQCNYRYKIYVEGRTWSVSEKYILSCSSPTLLITPGYHDFFSRGLMPFHHYWPIRPENKCDDIKFAVDWGNRNPNEAQAIGRRGSEQMRQKLSMDYVYDYMFHLLNEYSKLLNYKPTIPPNAVEYCSETMACREDGLVRELMKETVVNSSQTFDPCVLPPPFTPEEKKAMEERNAKSSKQVEIIQNKLKKYSKDSNFTKKNISSYF